MNSTQDKPDNNSFSSYSFFVFVVKQGVKINKKIQTIIPFATKLRLINIKILITVYNAHVLIYAQQKLKLLINYTLSIKGLKTINNSPVLRENPSTGKGIFKYLGTKIPLLRERTGCE